MPYSQSQSTPNHYLWVNYFYTEDITGPTEYCEFWDRPHCDRQYSHFPNIQPQAIPAPPVLNGKPVFCRPTDPQAPERE